MDEKEKLNLDVRPSKDKAAGKGKRGVLSTAEKEFIIKNAQILDITNIAESIDKSVNTVRKFAYKENIPIKEKNGNQKDPRFYKLRKLLHSREYWKEMQYQFSPAEIKIFESTWIKIVQQFDEDILPTEELQIKKHITLDVLKDRFLKKSYNIEKQIENMQVVLDEEYAKPKEEKNIDAIKDLGILMDKLQRNQIDINKEINSIVDKIKDTEKALKGSRDQRVKDFIDAEKSWVNIIRLIENPEIRSSLGKHIELMRAAQTKQEMKLYDFHNFADSSVDRLILNSDSVSLEENEDNEVEDNE